MKNRVVRKDIYRSVVEFEKVFLPDTYKMRISSKQTDDRSLGISLANEVIEDIRSQRKRKK